MGGGGGGGGGGGLGKNRRFRSRSGRGILHDESRTPNSALSLARRTFDRIFAILFLTVEIPIPFGSN